MGRKLSPSMSKGRVTMAKKFAADQERRFATS